MKPFLLLAFCLCLLGHTNLLAESCRRVELAQNQRQLLLDYISNCYQKHHFFEGKGVVQAVIYQDEEGLTRWYLSARVDDRYRAMPPEQYALLNNNVVLIYQGTPTAQPLPIAGDAASRNACIQEVVGGRVYHYTNEPSYTEVINEKGVREKVKVTTMTGGAPYNDLIIRFNKDGTVTKFQPV